MKEVIARPSGGRIRAGKGTTVIETGTIGRETKAKIDTIAIVREEIVAESGSETGLPATHAREIVKGTGEGGLIHTTLMTIVEIGINELVRGPAPDLHVIEAARTKIGERDIRIHRGGAGSVSTTVTRTEAEPTNPSPVVNTKSLAKSNSLRN